VDVRVISLGTLSANPLWHEREPVRTGHATTTLIRAGERVLLVDPGLPEPALAARLHERSGLRPGAVTDVFLTCFKPDMTRGLRLFDGADWWIDPVERETVGVLLADALGRAARAGTADEDLADLRERVAQLRRCRAVGERVVPGVDPFPLHGVTPGLCGLLVPLPSHTLLVCSDAIPDADHLAQGRVPDDAADVDKAREAFGEAVEIADLLICGRDGLVVNPTKRPF